MAEIPSIMQVWVGAAAIMAALGGSALLVFWIRRDRTRWTNFHPRRATPTNARLAELSRRRSDRILVPLLDLVGDRLQRLAQPSWLRSDSGLLERSGPHRWLTTRRYSAMKALLFVPGALLGWMMARGLGGDVRLLLAVVVGVLATRAPGLWLARAADRRAAQITRELPDVLDQITIAVGAGLGLDAAINRVATRSRGVLGAELTRAMQDIRVGISRSTALGNLAQRSGSEDLGHLVSALLQGIEMGMPLAPVLEARAVELRRKRRAAAEERAHKLSVKLTFPTAICILPALLLVVIGPAILTVMDSNFGG